MFTMDTDSSKDNRFSDLQEIEKTWQHVENSIKTIGFGDGISFGRDSTFQDYFNKGFIEGFRSGYTVGACRGFLFCQLTQKKEEVLENQLIMNPKSAWCQICDNKDLSKKSIADVVTCQTEIYNKNLKELVDAYHYKP